MLIKNIIAGTYDIIESVKALIFDKLQTVIGTHPLELHKEFCKLNIFVVDD